MKHAILTCLMLVLFVTGVVVGHYKVFPFDPLHSLKIALLGEERRMDAAAQVRAAQFEVFVSNADVVMIGDSLTQNGLWSDMFPSVRVANRGIGGDRTSDVLVRMDAVLATQAKHAFVMLGINDIYAGRAATESIADLSAILARLRQAGVTVYLQSIVECAAEVCGKKTTAVRRLNAALAVLAADAGVAFIDLNAGLSDEMGLRAEFTYDGVHLNAAGYAAWAKVLAPYIAPIR